MKEFIYICVDNNGNYFATAGNFKHACNRPCSVYPITDEYVWCYRPTPFGYMSNTDSKALPDKFEVIFQYKLEFTEHLKRIKYIPPKIDGKVYHRCFARGMITRNEFINCVKALF